ncbi:MAG: YceI family protein [Chitinophagales bacterium]|nr:YceI family protein [Chitinophagales bacterium]
MKEMLLIVIALFCMNHAEAQDVFLSSSGTVSFFSETPVENIDATSNQVVGAVNVKTKSIFFKAKITTFAFKKALMQEHFNENYLESDKFPYSTFNGIINEPVDFSKDGDYKVTVTGTLNLHGVDQSRTIPGNITVKDGSLILSGEFMVKLADHDITIPTVVTQNIAETVKVKVQATLLPVKSDK